MIFYDFVGYPMSSYKSFYLENETAKICVDAVFLYRQPHWLPFFFTMLMSLI